MRNEDVERVFGIGELIEFSAQEFLEICWSVYFFSKSVLHKAIEIAKSYGVYEEEGPGRTAPR